MTNRYAFWIAAATVLAGLTAVALWTTTLDYTVAWTLYLVEVVRHGGRLYRDVVDTDSPVILYLMWPAAWLRAITRMDETSSFRVYEFAIAVGAAAVSARLSRRVWPRATPVALGLIGLTVTFVLLPFLRHDFGQRDHFAVMLTLPYVLLAATDARGRRTLPAVAIGVLAGLGFSIKPQFAIVWAGLEAFVWSGARRERPWRRPELLAAAVSAGGMLALQASWIADYLAVARDAGPVLAAQQSTIATLLGMPDVLIWIAAAALLIVLRLRPETRRPGLTLFVAATGYLLAGLVQRRGSSADFYPARAFMAVFFVAFLLALLETLPELLSAVRGGMRNAAALLTLALLALSVRYVTADRLPHRPDLVAPLVELIRHERPAGPLATLSMRTLVYPAFPAVNETGAAWSLRYDGLWFLPGLYERELLQPDPARQYRAPAGMSPVERGYFDAVVSDVCAKPPGVLMVEPPVIGAPAGRRTLDLVGYYRQDPRFDRLFLYYAPRTTLGTFTVYTAAPGASCRAAAALH